MRVVWYEPSESGYKRRWGDSLPSGRYRTIDGKNVRLGPPSCPTHIGSDDLGTHGIINHADGKHYTSRSLYTRAVKANGCEIIGNDWKPSSKEIRGDFNVRRELKQAVQKVLT